MEHFFSPNSKWTPTLRCTQESNYWGDADVDHTQTIGGDTANPPGFRHPCRHHKVKIRSTRLKQIISFRDIICLFTR